MIRNDVEYIRVQQMEQFIQQLQILVEREEVMLLYYRYDRVRDGKIGLNEFEKMILPNNSLY